MMESYKTIKTNDVYLCPRASKEPWSTKFFKVTKYVKYAFSVLNVIPRCVHRPRKVAHQFLGGRNSGFCGWWLLGGHQCCVALWAGHSPPLLILLELTHPRVRMTGFTPCVGPKGLTVGTWTNVDCSGAPEKDCCTPEPSKMYCYKTTTIL